MITTKLKLMLLPLVALASLSSCSREEGVGGPDPGNGSEVVFSMRIPANHIVTRSLTETDEYEVETLDVLLFDTSTGLLLSRATNSGSPVVTGEHDLDFYVKLAKDDDVENYDFILLANARDLITTELYSDGNLSTGMSKAEVQAALKASLTAGTGWINDNSAADYKAMPMWGELIDQTIEAGKTYDRTTMLRATVKIDLEVALTDNTFDLEEVWYYHYNTEGFVIPLAANLENGTPTINGLTLNENDPVDYSSAISGDKKSLKYAIYGFEGPEGSMSEYLHNPCLLIKGSFNDGAETWYRLDFANVDEDDLTSTYLPLLRNHQYNVEITAINGPGYGEKEDALNSKPGNVATSITVWDGEDVSGIWNGNYEIKFTSLNAHFTQFGTPAQQVITVTTNCPELTFENFTNISKGSTDADWTETSQGSGTWTNGHFTVMIVKGPTVSDKTTYTLIFTSEPTTVADPARESRFKIKGKNMEANITVTQDAHEEYRLITTPDPLTTPITIDGAVQTIRVDVTSTHPYDIVLNNSLTGFFAGVYSDATGAVPLSSVINIPTTQTTVYVKVNAWDQPYPRVSDFRILHNTSTAPNSDAAPLTFNVLQVTPAIKAVLSTGGYEAKLQKGGGHVTINVESNMNQWTALVTEKVGTGPATELNATALAGLFDHVTGSGNGTVTFTLLPLGDNETEDKVYTITFKDANGTVVSTPAIVITQKAKLPGLGGGGEAPTSGVRAEPGILSVNTKGQLNLDGDGWIVYFKWGSTIAIAGGNNGDEFDSGDIAWTPEGYPYDTLMENIGNSTGKTAWDKVPYHNNGFVIIDNAAFGKGDPCKLAVKGGAVGGYRMPTGNSVYEQYDDGGWDSYNGYYGRWSHYGGTQSQFYPVAGLRNYTDGTLSDVGVQGRYWSSTQNGTNGMNADNQVIISDAAFLQGGVNGYGMSIRCVKDELMP